MPRVAFEHMTAVFERAKTVLASARVATLIVFPRIHSYQLTLTMKYFTECQKIINFILIYNMQSLLYLQSG
jgi:hypothetical protein